MTSSDFRRRLLAGTASLAAAGLGLSSPASAQCVRSGNNLTCDTTITTDTINDGSSPASDRVYTFDLSAGNSTVTVAAGRTVSGYGLFAGTEISGANTLSMVNNGSVVVDTGNVVQYGGGTALGMFADGATSLSYSGAGSIINNGSIFTDGLVMTAFGTGNITANVGGTITVNGEGYGVAAFQVGTSGSVSISTEQAATIRAGDIGLYAGVYNDANSTGQINITNRGGIFSPAATPGDLRIGILAEQAALGSVSILNSGNIGSASDRAERGIRAEIDNLASNGSLTISSNGSIYATTSGIVASTTGTGNIGVSTGNFAFNVTGGTANRTGIETVAGAGATTINIGTGGMLVSGVGIRSTSSTGAQFINVAGVVDAYTNGGNDGIQAVSGSGAIAVTVANGGAIRGSDDAISIATSGAKTITIASGGTLSGSYAIYAGGSGTTTIVNGGSIAGSYNTILAMNSAVGAFSITNQASGNLSGGIILADAADTLTNAGTYNVVNTADFRGGSDTLTNQAGGIINVASGSSFTSLETLTNAGTINAASGLALNGAATAFANSGTLNLGGALNFTGGGSLTSSGTINAVGGASAITVPTLTNSGIINLRDGATNDTLTVTGNYVGSGNAVVRLDYGQSSADRLVITGNASGSTRVELTAVPGTTRIDATGLLLVDVTGTSSANAFTVAAASFNPLIDFSLQQRGADFFLVALPNSSGLRPLVVPNVAADLWYHGADMVASVPTGDGNKPRFWAQGSIGRDRYGDNAATVQAFGNSIALNARQRNDRIGLQVGAELPFSGAAVGVTAGWQRGESRFGGVEMIEARGWNLGAYGRIGGEAGLSASLLAKYDRNEVELDDQLFTGLVGSPDSRSIGLSGEVGYRFGMAEVGGGLAWVRTSLDDFRAAGIAYRYDDQRSVRGHVGAKLGLDADLGAHVEGKLLREFAGDTDLTLTSGSSDTVTGRYRGTWGRIGAGIGGTAELPALVKAWADVGDVRGFGLSAGLTF